jgi:hypothetical protein
MLHGDVHPHGRKSFRSVADQYHTVTDTDLEVTHIHVTPASMCVRMCVDEDENPYQCSNWM